MTFHVGQKVVRISGADPGYIKKVMQMWRERYGSYSYPEIDDVVTIRSINSWPHATLLTFFEHDNSSLKKKVGSKYEPGFDAAYFRPLVERKTDISFAHEILRKTSQGVEVC